MGAAEAGVGAYVAAWQPSSASAAAASFARAVVERAGRRGTAGNQPMLTVTGRVWGDLGVIIQPRASMAGLG
jgi:hypothetical protein